MHLRIVLLVWGRSISPTPLNTETLSRPPIMRPPKKQVPAPAESASTSRNQAVCFSAWSVGAFSHLGLARLSLSLAGASYSVILGLAFLSTLTCAPWRASWPLHRAPRAVGLAVIAARIAMRDLLVGNATIVSHKFGA